MSILNLGQHAISTEILLTENGENISLDKYHFVFNKWTKPHSFDTYGGKQILELNNEPLFAELLVLRLLEQQDYKGIWVDTYRNKFWQRLPHFSFPVLPDKKIIDYYNKIYKLKGGKKEGCFDIIAYKDDHFIFAELKRKSKDKIRLSQIEWLQSALRSGLGKTNFLIAEWETN